MKKFIHNSIYDEKFKNIENIRFYPYVGKTFPEQGKRIMVFGYNAYVDPKDYDSEEIRTQSKTHYADALEEFTYKKGEWTKAFRYFIKASLCLSSNYSENSSIEITSQVDQFVEKISYINYINGSVPSERPLNIKIDDVLIDRSNKINMQLIDILDITHIVCWGSQVFNHVLSFQNFKPFERISNLDKIDGLSNKKGFEYANVFNEESNKFIHVLKIFHPSMPQFFGAYDKKTQEILSWFYQL